MCFSCFSAPPLSGSTVSLVDGHCVRSENICSFCLTCLHLKFFFPLMSRKPHLFMFCYHTRPDWTVLCARFFILNPRFVSLNESWVCIPFTGNCIGLCYAFWWLITVMFIQIQVNKNVQVLFSHIVHLFLLIQTTNASPRKDECLWGCVSVPTALLGHSTKLVHMSECP